MAKVEATNGKAVNFKIMASVLSALETKILSGTGRYPPGVTDETIAKETGAAVAFVRQAREELYGVQVHPDIAALLDRLDALDGELAAIRGLLQDVEAKRATLAADVKKMEYDPRFRL